MTVSEIMFRGIYFPKMFSELVFRRVCVLFGLTPPDREFLALEIFEVWLAM